MHVHIGGCGHGDTGGRLRHETRHSLPFTILRWNLGLTRGDLSAWSTPNRARHYRRLFASGVDWGRILHGSDYPVPAVPWAFIGRLPAREIRRCSKIRNPFDRDVELKRAIGIPESVFANASRIFRWRPA